MKLHFEAFKPGLPDGIFSNQKSQFGSILEDLAKEDVDTFYCHLVYLRPFGIFCCDLVNFMVILCIFPVLVCCTKKNLATLIQTRLH
jgi:hypothetical protein